MKQQQIDYHHIMSLGFTEQIADDSVYVNEFGYDYAIITKWLTKKIYLDWTKDERICNLHRIDSPKTCNILATMQIKNLKHLQQIINFYTNQDETRN